MIDNIIAFLEYLYPSDYNYEGKILLFNIDTKASEFIEVADKDSVVNRIEAEAAKGNTIQINLALQLEKEAKIEKVQESKSKHEIIEALYKNISIVVMAMAIKRSKKNRSVCCVVLSKRKES